MQEHSTLCVLKECHKIPKSINPDEISVNLNINNNEPYIILNLPCANRPVKFLIDSGASASFISGDLIKKGTRINVKNKINVKSATGHSVRTLASVTDFLLVGDHRIEQTFHIFGNNIPITADGILGFDFLKDNNCVIDISSQKILFQPKATISGTMQTVDSENNESFSNSLPIVESSESRLSNKKFNFPEKKFPTKLKTIPLFSVNKFDQYNRMIQNQSFSANLLLPENSLKWVDIKTYLYNGNFAISRIEILPNIFTTSSIVSIKDEIAKIPIFNKNNFPIFLPDKYINSNFFSDISGYNVFIYENRLKSVKTI